LKKFINISEAKVKDRQADILYYSCKDLDFWRKWSFFEV